MNNKGGINYSDFNTLYISVYEMSAVQFNEQFTFLYTTQNCYQTEYYEVFEN